VESKNKEDWWMLDWGVLQDFWQANANYTVTGYWLLILRT